MALQTQPDTMDDAAISAFSKLALMSVARASVFRLLATAFYDPTPELVQQLVSGTYISELNGYYADLVSYYRRGQDALSGLMALQSELGARDQAELLKELRVEYARLFIGPGHPAVQPYETFYDPKQSAETTPLLMVSPAAMAVEQAYLDAGLAMSSNRREPPDHFAVELEFSYYLSKKESDAWAERANADAKKWRRRELAFIDGHLGCWAQAFCEKVQAESTEPFYRALAGFASILLRLEGSHAVVNGGGTQTVLAEKEQEK